MKRISIITNMAMAISFSAFAGQKNIAIKEIESYKSIGQGSKSYLVLHSADGEVFYVDSSEDLMVKMVLSASARDTLRIQYDENSLVKVGDGQYAGRHVIKSMVVQKRNF